METAIIAFIVIMNLASILVIFKALSNIELKNKIILVAIGEIVMYVILYIVYSISSAGANELVVNSSRQIILFTLLPINIVCLEFPLMLTLKKLQQGDIDDSQFKKRMTICLIVCIIVLVLEFVYIKDIQAGISNFAANLSKLLQFTVDFFQKLQYIFQSF